MTEFYPPVQERENEDLMGIAISSKGDWQEEIVKQAIEELWKRGITSEQIERTKENVEAFMKEEEVKRQKQLEKNEKASYKAGEIILIILISPLILLGKSYGMAGLSLDALKEENFKIKYKQRLFYLIFGTILWIIFFWLAI